MIPFSWSNLDLAAPLQFRYCRVLIRNLLPKSDWVFQYNSAQLRREKEWLSGS